MTAVFADTSFYVAVANARDSLHETAKSAAASICGRVVTTEFVLTEVANFLSDPSQRLVFVHLVGNLRSARDVEIIPASSELFQNGLALFTNRPDKRWSLTDCTSIHVMNSIGIVEVLSADRHFEQAGFRVLLAQPGHQIGRTR